MLPQAGFFFFFLGGGGGGGGGWGAPGGRGRAVDRVEYCCKYILYIIEAIPPLGKMVEIVLGSE